MTISGSTSSSSESLSSLELTQECVKSDYFDQFIRSLPLELSNEGVKKLAQAILKEANTPQDTYYKVKKSSQGLECSFWIQFDSDTSIRIHKPKGLIGRGTYKRIKYAVEVSLHSKQCFEVARLRPADKTKGWYLTAIQGFQLQKFLYEALKHRGALSCIAVPPEPTVTNEYLQPFYPLPLRGLKNNAEIFSEFSVLFSTIDGIHRQGYIHCDLKPDNLQLNYDRHIVLNDFDHCGFVLHGSAFEYEFWDLATQKGLRNPYADVVGGMVCLLFTLFPAAYKDLKLSEDVTHSIFKGQNAVKNVSAALGVAEADGPHMKVIELACKVFQAENRIFSAIVSSLIYNCMKAAGVDGQSLDRLSIDAALSGLMCYIGTKFSDPELGLGLFLQSVGHPIWVENAGDIADFMQKKESSEDLGQCTEFEKLLEIFYSTATPEIRAELHSIAVISHTLETLLYDDTAMELLDLESADEHLFLQLVSHDPEERMKGYTTLKTLAPSALDVQLALQDILITCEKGPGI